MVNPTQLTFRCVDFHSKKMFNAIPVFILLIDKSPIAINLFISKHRSRSRSRIYICPILKRKTNPHNLRRSRERLRHSAQNVTSENVSGFSEYVKRRSGIKIRDIRSQNRE